jgi:hypothetical protein
MLLLQPLLLSSGMLKKGASRRRGTEQRPSLSPIEPIQASKTLVSLAASGQRGGARISKLARKINRQQLWPCWAGNRDPISFAFSSSILPHPHNSKKGLLGWETKRPDVACTCAVVDTSPI